jgi:hypothetical protein
MNGDLRDVASPDEVAILRSGVELYLARCEADRELAANAGSAVTAEYWSGRITQTQALLARLRGPSAFVRRPRTVIRGRQMRLTCDDDV